MEWHKITTLPEKYDKNDLFLTHYRGTYALSYYDERKEAFYVFGGEQIFLGEWTRIIPPNSDRQFNK